MKAIVCEKYGPPELLQLKEVPKPDPGTSEVLVKIHATAINDYDWSMVRGKPLLYRLFFGLFRPKRPIPGMELSGTIEDVGKSVSKFNIGDAVYGDTSDHGFGTFAEYICLKENALTLMPLGMSFEEASAIPHASMLAFQGLFDIGKLESGQKVLINGAGGGVGTFALQLAKMHTAEVTGVDTGEKLKAMTAMGFDHVLDYKKTDFTKAGVQYDLILDAKSNKSPFSYLKALKKNGKYVTIGGNISSLFKLLILKWGLSRITHASLHILALKPNKDLDKINRLFQDGMVKPVIDGPYSLEEIPSALRRFGEGRHTGKIVIQVAQ